MPGTKPTGGSTTETNPDDITDEIEERLRARIHMEAGSQRTSTLALINILWDRGQVVKAIPLLERLLQITPMGEELEIIALARLRLSVAIEKEAGLTEHVFAPGALNQHGRLQTKHRKAFERTVEILTQAVREWPTYDREGRQNVQDRLALRQRALGLMPDDASNTPSPKAPHEA